MKSAPPILKALLLTRAAMLLAFLLLAPQAWAEQSSVAASATPAAVPPGTFDLDKDRDLNVPLGGLWHFHTGDDPSWSSPSFDDSHWHLIRADDSWTSQGYKGDRGVAWYRATILVPANAKPLALYIPFIDGSFQVFADGQLIATQGGLPPRGHPANQHATTVLLPQFMGKGGHSLCLAIRVWQPFADSFYGGGIQASIRGRIRIGGAKIMQDLSVVSDWSKAFDSVSMIFLALLETLAGLTALALFAFRRTEREYLWFGVALFLSSVGREITLYKRFHLSNTGLEIIEIILSSAGILAEIFFYSRLLRAKRNWLYRSAMVATVADALLNIYESGFPLNSGLTQELDFLLALPFAIWIVALVLRRARQGIPDGRLLIAPILMQQFVYQGDAVVQIGLSAGWIHSMPRWYYDPVNWPFSLSIYDIPDALFLLAMLAILIYRFSRTRLQEETYEREHEAARTVQQVLIPQEAPQINGFEIASIYKPFGEVGGDFFQVVPIESGVYTGSVVAVIGDVSGKGLPAALAVSLLVGTFRTLVDYTQGPAEILTAMNQRMCGRSNGGFTTCLVFRSDPDGTLTIANAGHLSPYTNNKEIPVDCDLPLGLLPDANYVEVVHHIAPAQSITLLTDGVIEARSEAGELFGFERTLAISHLPAAEIAQIARQFGQDDDITVLQLSRTAP